MLTSSEIKLLDILYEIRDVFSAGKVGRVSFQTVMGHIRDGIVLLENKKFGCQNGRHKGDCLCYRGIVKAISTVKDNRYKAA